MHMSILNFPTEILLQIFSGFDYVTLRFKIAGTCRHFRDVIQAVAPTSQPERLEGHFPETLHIDKISDSSLSRIKAMLSLRTYTPPSWPNAVRVPAFTYHPMLPLLRTRESATLVPLKYEDIGFEDSAGKFTPLMDTFIAEENVTSPAYDYVGFTLTWRDFIRGREECERTGSVVDRLGTGNAVTMQNFILGMVEVFNIKYKLNADVFDKKGFLFDQIMGRQVRENVSLPGAIVAEVLLHITNF